MKKILLLLGALVFISISCRKDEPVAGGGIELRFSKDTIFLDTVFTTVGSSTYNLRVVNPTNEKVVVDNIRLGRGPGSEYRLNINGIPSKNLDNVEILANDSIHIFIEVTASEINGPDLLYVDSILFSNKGIEQNVKLVTLARDVYFHYPTNFLKFGDIIIPYSIATNTPEKWPCDKPHVVYGYAVVDEGGALDIPKGTEVYFHNNSGLWVFSGGRLTVGESSGSCASGADSVIFAGDRLEPFYEDIPGQWGGPLGGIFIGNGSIDNSISNCVIKNATTAIRIDSNDIRNFSISNSYILNSSRIGLYGGYGRLKAQNLVIANAGLYLFYAFGGEYEFRHCTFANYWQDTRSTAGVTLANYIDYQEGNQIARIVRSIESAYFGNCIVDGANSQELDILKSPGGVLNYQFRNAIIKTDLSLSIEERGYDINDLSLFTEVDFNKTTGFVDVQNNQYALDTVSQAVNQGNIQDATDISTDILGNPRFFGGSPDLGAFERQF